MAWVTWQQHRAQLAAMAGLVLLAGVAALVVALPIWDAYHRLALSSCLPPAARPGCDVIVGHFRSDFGSRANAVRYLALAPALAGLFVGVPLFTREFEHGTIRLAWTQGVSRRRWLLAKTGLLALATVAGAAALAGIVMWWRLPLDRVNGRISPVAFDVEGLVVPAYAFFALAIGILAGLLLRRTLAAATAAVAAFVAVRIGVEWLLRPHYLAPARHTGSVLEQGGTARDWVLDNALVDAVGRTIGSAREDAAVVHAQRAGIDAQQYLASLGWHRVVTYQPDGRFWAFQAVEFGIFVALGVAAILAALALVRRRPA